MTVRELKEFIQNIPDETEIAYFEYNYGLVFAGSVRLEKVNGLSDFDKNKEYLIFN